jgi:hypothetical protein
MRDLPEDLEAGLVNIPREVVLEAFRDGVPALDHGALISSEPVRRWMRDELARAETLLAAADRRLSALRGRRGVRILRRFARSMRGFAHGRLPRRYPWLPRGSLAPRAAPPAAPHGEPTGVAERVV